MNDSIKHMLILLIFTISTAPANAKKKFKIIKCPQADGTIVLQDFACMQTTTQKTKPTKPKAIKKQKKLAPKPRIKPAPLLPKPLQTPKKLIKHKQDIRQIPQWNTLTKRLNPNNLQQKKLFQNNAVNIMVATVTPAQKITLTHYPNSSKILGQKAFSAAISIFRQVTHDQTQQVTESEYIPNSNYKVFNLYHRQQNQRHFKQFYIDEHHDSLYVLELTAPAKNWNAAQQTIAQITAQLKL